MAAELHAVSERLTVGSPQPLCRTNVDQDKVIRNDYAASTDGQRFLVMSALVDPAVSPLVAVLNWAAALSQK